MSTLPQKKTWEEDTKLNLIEILFVVLTFSVWAELETHCPTQKRPSLGGRGERKGVRVGVDGQNSGPILPQYWETRHHPLFLPPLGIQRGEQMESWAWGFSSITIPPGCRKTKRSEKRREQRKTKMSRKMRARGEGWRRESVETSVKKKKRGTKNKIHPKCEPAWKKESSPVS